MQLYKILATVILLALVLFLFNNCAQKAQPLSGGKRDSLPPIVRYSKPLDSSTNVYPTKITFRFNEYFVVKDLDKNFFVSIPIYPRPAIKIKQKKLIVSLPKNLKDSTTYYFNLNKLIADFHEGNIKPQLEFVFSTYNIIDSFQISGRFIDAQTNKPIDKALIGLYHPDSLPQKSLPLYTAYIDTVGKFVFKNIKKSKYRLIAFVDDNANFIYDQVERKIGFVDTLVEPYIVHKTITQKIDSGKTIPNKFNPKKVDTLKKDTTIVYNITKYLPDNLTIRLFDDIKDQQKIYKVLRYETNHIKLFFLKPIFNNFFELYDINGKKLKYDFRIYNSNDSLSVWLHNPQFFNTDTIRFIAKYFNEQQNLVYDTLRATLPYLFKDTIPLTVKLQYNKITQNSPLILQHSSSIKNINPKSISIFRIVDTVVDDLRQQKLTIIRNNYDSLLLFFARPIKKIDIVFLNSNKPNIYTLLTNNTRDTVICRILDKEIYQTDSLRFTVIYDNQYFFDQTQYFANTYTLGVNKLILKQTQRNIQDQIVLTFNKKISSNLNLSINNFDSKDFKYKIDFDKIYINLLNPKLINTDTIVVKFRIADIQFNNTQTYYSDSATSIFKFDYQRITYSRRYHQSRILFVFHKPLIQFPQIDLLSLSNTTKWYSLNSNKNRDSITIVIQNNLVKRLKNIAIAVRYFDINHHNDTIHFTDTLRLDIQPLLSSNIQTIGKEKPTKLFQPTNFSLQTDSSNSILTQIYLNTFIPGNYLIKIDSAAFVDYRNKINDTTSFDFVVIKSDELASLKVNIENIASLEDSTQNNLSSGQLIIQLFNKDNLFKQISTSTNGSILLKSLLPDKYQIKIIYDKNKNGFWDCGDFARALQPEYIFTFPEINLNSAKTEQFKIDFKELLK